MTVVIIADRISCLLQNKVLFLCHEPKTICSSLVLHCGHVKHFPSAALLLLLSFVVVLVFIFLSQTLKLSTLSFKPDKFHTINHSLLHTVKLLKVFRILNLWSLLLFPRRHVCLCCHLTSQLILGIYWLSSSLNQICAEKFEREKKL